MARARFEWIWIESKEDREVVPLAEAEAEELPVRMDRVVTKAKDRYYFVAHNELTYVAMVRRRSDG